MSKSIFLEQIREKDFKMSSANMFTLHAKGKGFPIGIWVNFLLCLNSLNPLINNHACMPFLLPHNLICVDSFLLLTFSVNSFYELRHDKKGVIREYASTQTQQDLRCPFTNSADTVGYIEFQQRPFSDCAAFLADFDLYSLYILRRHLLTWRLLFLITTGAWFLRLMSSFLRVLSILWR